MDSVVCFVDTDPLDSDLSGKWRRPAIEPPRPELINKEGATKGEQRRGTIGAFHSTKHSGNIPYV